MYRKFWLPFIVVAVSGSFLPCFAQHSIEGRVIDEEGEPLTYANVVLLSPADSTMRYFDVADKEGKYQIKNIEPGDYLVQFSFVTKETIYEEVAIPSDSSGEFGDTVMKAATTMDEVVVAAEYIPIQIKQDTVAFNAKGFKTKTGAVVEDLLKKIPGVEVDKAGNVKALGEDVNKVLVDGKEFFGKDPKVATKNLPADAVDKVQVYDKKTEEAEFMGVDDGVRERTINLLLNEDNKKGYFGNARAGGGTGSHYNTGGKIYRFSSRLQSALLGMYNNVNEFRFTGKDMEEFGKRVSGLNTTAAGGFNLSYNETEYNRYFLSYLANSTENNLKQKTTTENFLEDGSYHQLEELDKEERNTPHRIDMGVRHKFNKRHNLTIDGDIDMASSTAHTRVSRLLKNRRLDNPPTSDLDNVYDSKSDQIHIDVRGADMIKLSGDRTQLKTNIFALFDRNSSEADWTNTTTIVNRNSATTEDQYREDDTEKFTLSVHPTLVQKINPFWHLSASVDLELNKNDLNRREETFGQDEATIGSLVTDFSTNESFVKPSLSLQRGTGQSHCNFILGTSWNRFDRILSNSSVGKSNHFYFLPGFTYHNNYRKGRHLHVRYNSSAHMPAAHQLLPVTDTVNRLSLYRGNIDLTPEYRHDLSLGWSFFDHFSFTSLFARLGASYTKDKISWSQTVNEDFSQLRTPVNVSYLYTAFSYIYFSTPMRTLGIKVNATSHESWSRRISVVNSADNIQTVFTHTVDLNFENRRKETWDARVGGSVSLTDSRFSIADNNVYFNTKYYADVGFNPAEQWDFWVEGSVVDYDSKSFGESANIPSLDAGISFHLKGERASFELRGVDLLDKDSGFQRLSETNYLMQRESNSIGRYAMLAFKLRIGR